MSNRKVGVLGSGDVGKVLAAGFHSVGDEVKIGSREPQKLAEWARAAGKGVANVTFEEAAKFGDIIVLATLGQGTENAIRLAGPKNFAGKVVIDATNPLDFSTGMPQLYIGHKDSLGEQVQRWVPDAKVVKAFNSVGNAHMIKPQFPGGPPDMFIAGNDEAAKRTVTQICQDFGWGVIDTGGIEGSRYLEQMCLVWVLDGFRTKSWNHAFKMLHR
ncbi:MAG TPA: NAD(P)-binding domain-containing protein [Thermoanaerobaculia bacterium]|nr:NAD(P)-binding domain-containing protein [Thermoanaerobaculia bacterium]